jgi:predicted dehydrogenase
MNRPLGVAVVGLGVGQSHARAYAHLDQCRLRWFYDLDLNRARTAASQFGGVDVAPAWDAILSDRTVDIVSIASYDDAHFEQVVQALGAGKHVFVEKPLCRTLEELKAVREAACARHSHLASNLVLRAAPVYTWLREAIRDGRFGDVYAVDGDYLYGRLSKITQGWRTGVSDYSVMSGGGIHMIDLMMWLFRQRPARVTALGNRVCTSGTAFRYDDYQAATFQFGSPLIGRITANFGCVHPHQHVLRIFGTRATFLLDDQGPRVSHSRDSSSLDRLDLATLPASKGALIPAFVERVLRRCDTAAEMQHEYDVISACVAAERAARLGERIDVEYI